MTHDHKHTAMEAEALKTAASDLLEACIEDFGLTDNDTDEEAVALGTDGPVAVKFGHLRRLQAALATVPQAATVERVRHLKRGFEYEVIGEAEAQVAVSKGWRHFPTGVDLGDAIPAALIHDESKITVYRCLKTGKLWCRFTDEFRDGRFETIAAPTAPTAPEHGGGDEALSAELWQAICRHSSPTMMPADPDPDVVTMHGGQAGYILWERDGKPFVINDLLRIVHREIARLPTPAHGIAARLAEALDQLCEAAEAWRSHGGDQAHRILPLIHPSFTAVYEAYKPLRGALTATPTRPVESGARSMEETFRGAFDAASLAPALPLADDPIDAVMALAAAARQSTRDDRGNAFVLQHIIRTVNSFGAARPSTTPEQALRGAAEAIEVEVLRMDTSRGPDFYVHLKRGNRSQTPHVFRERFKAEYEVAYLAWVLGLRSDQPSVLDYDEERYPNDPVALAAIPADPAAVGGW